MYTFISVSYLQTRSSTSSLPAPPTHHSRFLADFTRRPRPRNRPSSRRRFSFPMFRPSSRGSAHRRRPAAAENTPLLRNDPTPIPWRETWRLVRPYITPATLRLRLLALLSILAIIFTKLISLLPPYAYKLAVDTLSNNVVNGTSIVPYSAVLMYIVARISSSFLNGLRDYTYNIVSTHCTTRFSTDIFHHLQNLSLAFHLHRKTGEISRIMDRGTSSIDLVATTLLFTLGPTLLEVLLVTAIFFRLGTPLIAITIFVTVVLYFAFTLYFTAYRIQIRRDLIDSDNAVSEKAVDTLFNYETVKMFGMELNEVTSYRSLQDEYRLKYLRFRLTFSALNFGQNVIQLSGLGIAMLLATLSVANGQLTPGDFVLINTYVAQLFQPLFFLGSSYRTLTQAATDLEKCVALFHEPLTVTDAEDAKDLVLPNEDVLAGRVGRVGFDNVSFTYSGSERGVAGGLRNISFNVPPGKMLALVGASGVGKSTIMRLLLRFYDVDSGSVEIDGVDVRQMTQSSLRKRVGVVAQDTVLFNNSLRQNIGYGKPGASDVEIMHAARTAALGSFIEPLPEGLDTMVGERGVRLSGGERQRVGCARCIIKNPAIVLLDEATSALDTLTERDVQANLREVCRNRTTIAVAHRLSTIMMADEIVVLGKKDGDDAVGEIVERGSHHELLELNGVYAEMWTAQTMAAEKELSGKKPVGPADGNNV